APTHRRLPRASSRFCPPTRDRSRPASPGGRMTHMTGARTAVLTVSDGVTHGTRADESGDLAQTLLADAGYDVVTRDVVADERALIEETLVRLADAHALIVTTGGTGFGPRDVTPEATKAVLDREAPGLAELMRAAGLAHHPTGGAGRGDG